MKREVKSKILVCRDCNEEFVFTADAQAYFEARGLLEGPSRCKACHIESKKQTRLHRQEGGRSHSGAFAG